MSRAIRFLPQAPALVACASEPCHPADCIRSSLSSLAPHAALPSSPATATAAASCTAAAEEAAGVVHAAAAVSPAVWREGGRGRGGGGSGAGRQRIRRQTKLVVFLDRVQMRRTIVIVQVRVVPCSRPVLGSRCRAAATPPSSSSSSSSSRPAVVTRSCR